MSIIFYLFNYNKKKRLKRRIGIGIEEKDMKRDLGEGQEYGLERSRKAGHKRQFANLTKFLSIDIVDILLSITLKRTVVNSSILKLLYS